MTTRAQSLDLFLKLSGWGEAKRHVLAGDASNRRYDRLSHPTLGRAVLMDAPPEKGEDVTPFIKIATHLRRCGLSAPEVIARDTQNGFLILEDLGDDLFARVLDANPDLEGTLYTAAIDALYAAQHATPPAGLPSYGSAEMTQTAMLVADWYLAETNPLEPSERDRFQTLIADLLNRHLTASPVLVQRDYHAENLLWLPARDGVARVGLLDFQDAMLGDAAYDLASLLKDARRDVSADTQEAMIAHFLHLTGVPKQAFVIRYALCSAQRNLRILGVFARLAIRDGKRHYPDLMPRVWNNLQDDLNHPALSELSTWVTQNLPAPTPDIIKRIKAAHV